MIADRYTVAFGAQPGLITPTVREGTQHAWHQYCLLAEDPEGLRAALDEANIDSRIYYATPIHRQQVYSNHPQFNTPLPVTDDITHRLVAVPVHHQMTDEEVDRVIAAVLSSLSS